MYSSTSLLPPRSLHCKTIATQSCSTLFLLAWHHQYSQLKDATSVNPASPQTKVSIFFRSFRNRPQPARQDRYEFQDMTKHKFQICRKSVSLDYEVFIGLLIRQSLWPLSQLNRQKFDGEVGPTLSDSNCKMESML